MRLAIRAVVDVDGRKVGELWFTPREADCSEKNQHSCGNRHAVVGKAGRSQSTQPGESSTPAFFGSAGAKSLIEDCVDQTRRRFDLRHRMQAAHQLRNAGDHGRAVFARVRMHVELVTLVGAEEPVEIVAKACFNMFASPIQRGHEMLRAGDRNDSHLDERIIMTGALPFVGGYALVRFVRG